MIEHLAKENPDKIQYREIVKLLIGVYKIPDADRESFNGGSNRAKYYFPLYYYPVKILEYLDYIEYGAGIVRLKSPENNLKKFGGAEK